MTSLVDNISMGHDLEANGDVENIIGQLCDIVIIQLYITVNTAIR